MAKLETPAVVPAAQRLPRPAVSLRAGGSPDSRARAAVAEELADDEVFYVDDDAPGTAPAARGRAEPELRELAGEHDASYSDASYSDASDAGASYSGASDRLGHDDESVTERGFHASTFGLPRGGAPARLPIANLEMPSSSRLDLTPSPVPRVALTPATGAVDISLVPGPHGSRNLPTLAAHHALGRRPLRRPAAAVTLPPPRHAASERAASEQALHEPPRLGAGLAKDVRSSRREIVLGLAIGLGLSLVLAAAGQAYLREEPIAGSPVPAELESLTLSARPEAPPPARAQAAPTQGAATQADATHAAATQAAATQAAGAQPALAEPAPAAPTRGAAGNPSAGRAQGERATEEPSRAVAAGERPRAVARGVAPRAVQRRAHARRDGSQAPSVSRPAGAAPAEPNSYGGARPFEEPPQPRAPLSPAESAGLGLDLPL